MVMPTSRGVRPVVQSGGVAPPSEKRRPRLTLPRIITWVMVAAVVGLISAFIAQIGMFQSPYEAAPSERAVEDPEVAVGRVVRFTGFDADDQPFLVEARRAAQDKNKPSRVHLEEIKLEMRLKASGEMLLVTARQGVFDDKQKTLDLAGDVRMANTANYTAKMQTARVLLREKRLISQDPVEVMFPDGTISAGGLEMRDDGQQVYFTNGTRTTFAGQAARGDAETPAQR